MDTMCSLSIPPALLPVVNKLALRCTYGRFGLQTWFDSSWDQKMAECQIEYFGFISSDGALHPRTLLLKKMMSINAI